MDIAAYLKQKGLTQREFADLLGVTPGLVWQWINGYTVVTAERAKEIEEKTGGKVKRREVRPDIFGRAA